MNTVRGGCGHLRGSISPERSVVHFRFFHVCCCFVSCLLLFHFMSVDVSLHVCCCFYSMLAVVECLLILEGEHDRMSSLPRRSLPFHLLSLCFQLVLLSSFQISLPPFSCLSRTLHRFLFSLCNQKPCNIKVFPLLFAFLDRGLCSGY